jgi:signal transduction histidine kinase
MLAAVWLAPAVSAWAATNQKKIFLLYASRRDTQVAIVGDREMPRLIDQALGTKCDFYSEYIDSARFPDPEYKDAFRDYLRLKYNATRFDAVIAMHKEALEFVASARDEFFAEAPVVFFTDDRSIGRIANSVGVIAEQDHRRTLALALALQPDTTQVFVVIGNSIQDSAMEQEVRAQFASSAPNLTFTYSANLDTERLERWVASLPEHSIIYYVLFYQDAAGVNVNPLAYLERLSDVANRPIYSWVDSTMDRGVVGGSLASIETRIGVLAALAVRVLRGERADTIPMSTPDLNVNQVDWRQLQRWHISEARVPRGTIIRFREPSVWDKHAVYIVGASVLLLAQTALILGLLVQRERRRRAEAQVRGGQAALRASYERIRDLGGRLIAAQEAERSRIARELHDDIHQQLALLAIDLELLRVGLERRDYAEKLARETLDRAHAIGRSVRDISHRLHPARLRLIGLVAALKSLQREVTQPDMIVTFTHQNVPESIPHDLTLCFYRIAQEALQNAIKYSRAHEITVCLIGTSDALALTIADDGVGFEMNAVKDRGFGLISMSERLEPFGGTLNIQSRPGAGTRLEATVSLRATPPAAAVPSALAKLA